jgi:SulP family sulfate permease
LVQVQDAGLVFLSAAASSVAHRTSDDPSVTIPTTLVTLSLSTTFLGLVVYLIGKLRLANLVAYLPMPVVGGYLAFIGKYTT